MSKFIVSANYRDRDSEYRWLVRREDEPIENAVACKLVSATGIEFTRSGDESGFGCALIAVCENVSITAPEKPSELPHDALNDDGFSGKPIDVFFNGRDMRYRNETVYALNCMTLHDDGSITGYKNPLAT